MPEPLIRRAGSADAETLAALGAATFLETFGHLYAPQDLQAYLAQAYDLDRTRADLADPAKASWLVEADGVAIGNALAGSCLLFFVVGLSVCDELMWLFFLLAWQMGGFGARLFGEVMAWLQAGGPRAVWIGVWSENYGAQRFYARHGFEKAGEYDFHVGAQIDLEFIFRRRAESFCANTAERASIEHNSA